MWGERVVYEIKFETGLDEGVRSCTGTVKARSVLTCENHNFFLGLGLDFTRWDLTVGPSFYLCSDLSTPPSTPIVPLSMAVQSKQAPPQQLTPLGYALAGALGGCFSNAYVEQNSTHDTHSPQTERTLFSYLQCRLPSRYVSRPQR
jgi:hypothetical protein